MRLSVIVPVYNEASTIREILRQVRAVGLAHEIIVVDDGSTDGTSAGRNQGRRNQGREARARSTRTADNFVINERR